MTLRSAGFSLEELGELPIRSWIDLYNATRASYWEDKATDVSVTHPAKPRDVQQKFIAAARRAWGAGGKPFWQDAKRMKAWLSRQTGVVVRDKGKVKE